MPVIMLTRSLLVCLSILTTLSYGVVLIAQTVATPSPVNRAITPVTTGERWPGWIADFEPTASTPARRVDLVMQQYWSNAHQFDERLTSSNQVNVTWTGYLEVKSPGTYRLALNAHGDCQLWLGDRSIIQSNGSDQPVSRSEPIELAFGAYPVRLQYRGSQTAGQLQLRWQGPGFQWEPISDRYLSHAADQHPPDEFERGRLLARGLRCEACHQLNDAETKGADVLLPSPDLTSLDGNIQREWLIEWLTSAPAEKTDVAADHSKGTSDASQDLRDDVVERRMPHFGLTQQQAADIAAALLQHSVKIATSVEDKDKDSKSAQTKNDKEAAPKDNGKADKSSKDKQPKRTQPDALAGEQTFLTRGCLACHSLSMMELGIRDLDDEATSQPHARQNYFTHQLFSGGDLSAIGSKRPAGFFVRWLSVPESINPSHRMPSVELTPLDRADIALYLASLSKKQPFSQRSADHPVEPVAARGDAARGASLIAKHRCAACHQLPEPLRRVPIERTRLTASSRWQSGCLDAPSAVQHRPGYGLTEGQRSALAYWSLKAKPTLKTDTPSHGSQTANLRLAELNCFACHQRDTHQGLATTAMQIVDPRRKEFYDPDSQLDLAARLPAMLPPSLNGVGDKFHEQALAEAITRPATPHRPWLDVRMPKFQLDDAARTQLVKHFVNTDRLPAMDAKPKVAIPDDIATRAAAGRLVTSEGFGCQSCHQIGNQPPPTVALNARGTDLTMLGGRVRQSWFDRWVRNPVRIVPRMEMPAIQLPVHGVMGNDLDRQIDAVWEMLNTKGFEPPAPGPVRIVRGHNLPNHTEPAYVLTDVLETPERTYLRPLIVGTMNRHSVLIDLERGELAKWWLGDTARELTRGKSWYWQLGGQSLTGKLESLVSFAWQDAAGQLWRPTAREQFVIEFDSLHHSSQGVRWQGRMHLAHGDQRRTVPISCQVEPHRNSEAAGDQATGIDLHFAVTLPSESSWIVDVGTLASQLQASPEPGHWTAQIDAKTNLHLIATQTLTGLADNHQLKIGSQGKEPTRFTVELRTTWPVDQVALDTNSLVSSSAGNAKSSNTTDGATHPTNLDVVPGFLGVQYPLPRSEMPTALAWYKGQLAIGSLKGRVCLAVDSDGDGWPDRWQPISDDLPAPYGLAASEQGIDVLAKFGLMRLQPNIQQTDEVKDIDTPWSMTNLADGWGYTADYHDWAVGLPQDHEGNYYVALPCQQDDRSPSAARLRGTIQKLTPQSPTSDDPRAYRMETLAAGQRFPMGLAFDSSGRLFATDNQGNYNPFNELNHIRAGKRYGFINKLESTPDFHPPLESPAVNLPHPWTRSVNGICFLNTPATSSQLKMFGPFEDHCIGCEYNGLSLIRMSLEEVDGVLQGAAYPFSRPVEVGQPTFEGPVVCAVSPSGALVVGSIHDSGWGGGQNTGSIVQLTPTGQWPLGIATVTAQPHGLRIEFTGSVDRELASDVTSYTIRSYRRVSTPAYGGNDQDERQEAVSSATLSVDGNSVDLTLPELRSDAVYEVRVGKVSRTEMLFPAEAHYTMKRVPTR